jgi:hypothetical protein
VRFGRFRTVSFDGCSSIRLADTERNVEGFGPGGRGGCPMLELMTLVETGTRALIGAVFGPTDTGETAYASRLLHHLRPDMLLLWDKGFDANAFLAALTGTGAQFLGRIRANRRTPVLARLADGSYLSVIGTVPVRIRSTSGRRRAERRLRIPPGRSRSRRPPHRQGRARRPGRR